MSAQFLIIRHVPHESAGTIESFLVQHKISFEYLNAYDGAKVPHDLNPYQALIVMGGPMNVDETREFPFLADEVTLIQNTIKNKKPVIGVCLGAQLMAKALGAKVYKGHKKEIGWFPIEWSKDAALDPVFNNISKTAKTVFHWHGDTFDLPNGAVRLASSKEYPNQLFKYGNSAYAFQFHVEVTADMARDWMKENQSDFWGTESYLDPKSVTADADSKAKVLADLAFPIYEKLFRQFGLIL